MKHALFATSAALLCLTLTTPAHAQAHFGISAGASIPESRFGESVSTGYNVNAMINVGVPLSPLGFRAEAGLNHFDFDGSNTSGSVRMINGSANVILTPTTIIGAKPYLIGGLGMYNVRMTFGGTATPLGGLFSGSAPGSQSSDTRLGFNGGVGLTFGLGSVGTLLEARYVTVNGKNGSGSLAFVPVTFGITF